MTAGIRLLLKQAPTQACEQAAARELAYVGDRLACADRASVGRHTLRLLGFWSPRRFARGTGSALPEPALERHPPISLFDRGPNGLSGISSIGLDHPCCSTTRSQTAAHRTSAVRRRRPSPARFRRHSAVFSPPFRRPPTISRRSWPFSWRRASRRRSCAARHGWPRRWASRGRRPCSGSAFRRTLSPPARPPPRRPLSPSPCGAGARGLRRGGGR